MSRHFWIILAVLIIATAIYYPFSPGGRQRSNMSRAEQHIPLLKAQIANDPRFASVQLNAYTGLGGSLLIRGEVASQEDAEALWAIIEKSNPPTPVAFVVQSAPGPATRPRE
jgi:hypothetical protein